MGRHTRQLTKREHYAADYATVFRSTDDSSATFDTATMQVRRVVPSGGEEQVQIEIELHTRFKRSDRTKNTFGTLILTPAQADTLIYEISKVRDRATPPEATHEQEMEAIHGALGQGA